MLDTENQLRHFIRNISDFPKPGIVFRDITPLLADPQSLNSAVQAMADPFRDKKIDIVVGAESRGFIFGTSIAIELNAGFVPVRKKGKLPAEVFSQQYQLEYGTDQLEIHTDAIQSGQNVLIADDLLATGGTMKTCCDLVKRMGAGISGITFLIELSFLQGRNQLKGYDIHSLLKYDSE